MDAASIAQYIASLGFPIVCCGVLMWYVWKKDEKHAAEVDELRKAFENVANVLQQLVDKLG